MNRFNLLTWLLFGAGMTFLPGCKEDEVENIVPLVTLTAPDEGLTLFEGEDVEITADATDSDGNITQVEFLQNGTVLYADESAPYSYTWTNLAVGTYAITAKAYDNGGGSTTSTAVNITVGEPTLIGSWNVTGAVFNPPIDTGSGTADFTDAYSVLFQQPCSQDNLFIFEANGIFKDDQGSEVCDTSEAQFQQGTYTESGTTVTVTVDGETTTFLNVVYTATTLTATVNADLGTITPIDFTMTRQ